MTDITKEYATALFELGLEGDSLKETYDGMKTVSAVFAETEGLADFLKSPGIPKSVRLQTLEDAFGDGVPENVLSLLCLLCEKEQVDFFDGIFDDYRRVFEDFVRTSRAVVTSAVELTDEEKSRLADALSKKRGIKKIKLEYKVDPSILGGIIVESEGEKIDGSVAGRLNNIKKDLKLES